jgi:hypothetical protein
VSGWSTPRPAALPSRKETQYPFYRRVNGPDVRSGWVWKISLSPGFYPWTVQAVASRYTDCAVPTQQWIGMDSELKVLQSCVSDEHVNRKYWVSVNFYRLVWKCNSRHLCLVWLDLKLQNNWIICNSTQKFWIIFPNQWLLRWGAFFCQHSSNWSLNITVCLHLMLRLTVRCSMRLAYTCMLWCLHTDSSASCTEDDV